MRVELFDFVLPEQRIALEPARPRDAARMLVVRPGGGIGPPRARVGGRSSGGNSDSGAGGDGAGGSSSGGNSDSGAGGDGGDSGRRSGVGVAGASMGGEATGTQSSDCFEDRVVGELADLLRPGDVLVFNDTRVIAAELTGIRRRVAVASKDTAPSVAVVADELIAGDGAGALIGAVAGLASGGGDRTAAVRVPVAAENSVGTAIDEAVARIIINLHKRVDPSRWLAFARPARRLKAGDRIVFGAAPKARAEATFQAPPDASPEVSADTSAEAPLAAIVEMRGDGGEVQLLFDREGAELDAAIAAVGHMPLPPYIASKRDTGCVDARDYQTIYARVDGAVAAPTAGLHFTEPLMARIEARGISRRFVTLHVGAGTFLPVKADDTAGHVMHAEWGTISRPVADALNAARAAGGRIIAVGTTSLRLLESAASEDGEIRPFSGETDIFITPGYRFRAVDLLLTNFHLPRSTLFMLVSAFSGRETMQAAYAHAIASGYRFYSYGDACLLHPATKEA